MKAMSLLFLCSWIAILGTVGAGTDVNKSGQRPLESKSTPSSKIDTKVLEAIQAKGVATVFVRLNVITTTNKTPKPEEKQTQASAIAIAQERVLQELAGTQYKLRRKFETVPTLSMEVGADALTVLERSSYVTRVYEVSKSFSSPAEVIPHTDKRK
jgi:hypothetical protein